MKTCGCAQVNYKYLDHNQTNYCTETSIMNALVMHYCHYTDFNIPMSASYWLPLLYYNEIFCRTGQKAKQCPFNRIFITITIMNVYYFYRNNNMWLWWREREIKKNRANWCLNSDLIPSIMQVKYGYDSSSCV